MTLRPRTQLSIVAAAALAFFAWTGPASAQDESDGAAETPTPPPQVDFGFDSPTFSDLPPPVEGDLLLSPGDMGGSCTCAVSEPPATNIDCAGMESALRAQANERRKEMINFCVSETLDQCEAQQGPEACAALPASFQSSCDPVVQGRLACSAFASDIRQQCVGAVDASMQRDFTPYLGEQIAACRAQRDQALAPWTNWCDTVAKPQACGVCDAQTADIASIEAEIESHREWIQQRRDGVAAIDDDPQAIPNRLDRIRQLETIAAQKRDDFEVMQETGYCP